MESSVCAQALLRDYPQGLLRRRQSLATWLHGHTAEPAWVVRSIQATVRTWSVPKGTQTTMGKPCPPSPPQPLAVASATVHLEGFSSLFPGTQWRLDAETGLCSQMVCMKTACESECHFQVRQTVLDHRNEST